MNKYNPDHWIVLKITRPGWEVSYKVLAGWSGSYLEGYSWRINSGIIRVEKEADQISFYGHTGSVYCCKLGGYGLAISTLGTYTELVDIAYRKGGEVRMLPEDTNWENFDWTKA